LGLDLEWKPSIDNKNPIATIQLASTNAAVVFQIIRMSHIPDSLKLLLMEERIRKIAQGFEFSDKIKLTAQRLSVSNVVDLQHIAREFGFKKVNLPSLVAYILGEYLAKDKHIQLSDWSSPLSHKQISYAATDAWVTLLLYTKLHDVKQKKQLNEGDGEFKSLAFNLFHNHYCFICDITFPSPDQFLAHRTGAHPNLHQCYKCGHVNRDAKGLELHKLRHFYRCGTCSFVFDTQEEYMRHILSTHHQRSTFNCNYCKTSLESPERLLWHESTFHAQSLNKK